MYLDNKYTKWYYSIITKAKNRENTGYTEKHHILPKSLGGPNHRDNIVQLTPKEHFIVHLLLTKMTVGNAKYKMNYALHMISNAKNIGKGRYIPSARIYEIVRKAFREALELYWTDEVRYENSLMKKQKGFKHKQESIEAIRDYQKNNKVWTYKAISTRVENCLKSAARRKGKKNEKHGKIIFEMYVMRNKEIFKQIWNLFDKNLNRRQISIKLGISWEKVNNAINKKAQILEVLDNK